MKFTIATIAILATAVSAQSIAELTAQLPACAATCLAIAIPASGCTVGDNACTCGTANAAITRQATPCVISGCSSEEALKTQSITSQICAAVAAGEDGGAASAAPSSVVSSMASMASMASMSTSAASAASSAATSAASSAASARSSVASSAGRTASPTASAPATATGNAAGKKEVGGLMAGAALLVAFAL